MSTSGLSRSAFGREGRMLAALATGTTLVGLTLQQSVASAEALPEDVEPSFDMGGDSGAEEPEVPKKRRRRRRVKKSGSTNIALPNPGKFEEAGQEAKMCTMVDTFGGGKLDISMPFFGTFVGYSANIDSRIPPHGRDIAFTAVNQPDQRSLFTARIDPENRLQGRFHLPLSDNTDLRAQFNLMEKEHSMQVLDLFYKGSDYSLHLSTVRQAMGLVVSGSYFQSVTPKLALGANLQHMVGAQTVGSYVLQYKNLDLQGEGHTVVASLEPATRALSLSLARKLSQNATVATEFKFGPRQGAGPATLTQHQSETTLGFMQQFMTFQAKGSISSTGKVCSTVSTQVLPVLLLSLSGEMTHGEKESVFGIGIQIETG